MFNLAPCCGSFFALPLLDFVQHPVGIAIRERDSLKPVFYLCEQDIFTHISLRASTLLFRTAIISISAARFSGAPLCGEHASTLSATKKIGEWKDVRTAYLSLAFLARKNGLDGFKLARRKNGSKASGKVLVVMFRKSQVRTIGENSFHGSFAKWRSGLGMQTEIMKKLRQRDEGMRPFGVLRKRANDNLGMSRVRLDISGSRIVHIAKGRFGQPLTAAQFLTHTTAGIFCEIVAVILGLAERHLQHKEPLRRGFKPKGRKAQRRYFRSVHGVDDAPTVNAISRQAVRMPRNNAACLATF